MSKMLGFESNQKDFLEVHPVVGFAIRLEVSCARLDQFIPIHKTLVLGNS